MTGPFAVLVPSIPLKILFSNIRILHSYFNAIDNASRPYSVTINIVLYICACILMHFMDSGTSALRIEARLCRMVYFAPLQCAILQDDVFVCRSMCVFHVGVIYQW